MAQEIIAEFGNSHEGSLGIAKSMIDIASEAGVKVVKFQMHISADESSRYETFRTQMSGQDATRQDYWGRTAFTIENWASLASYAQEKELEFLCTPFSVAAARILFENHLVKRWKVGSGDATNFQLLNYLCQTDMELIISTGLVNWNEIRLIRNFLQDRGAWNRTTLLYCVSKYPSGLSDFSLDTLRELKTLDCRIGFSDHSGNVLVPLFMLAHGVSIVEVHIKPHSLFYGPDSSSSILPEDLSLLVKASKDFDEMRASIKSVETLFEESAEMRYRFRKSLYWRESLAAGTIITEDALKILKPQQGIDSIYIYAVIGSKLICDVEQGTPVRDDQFESDKPNVQN